MRDKRDKSWQLPPRERTSVRDNQVPAPVRFHLACIRRARKEVPSRSHNEQSPDSSPGQRQISPPLREQATAAIREVRSAIEKGAASGPTDGLPFVSTSPYVARDADHPGATFRYLVGWAANCPTPNFVLQRRRGIPRALDRCEQRLVGRRMESLTASRTIYLLGRPSRRLAPSRFARSVDSSWVATVTGRNESAARLVESRRAVRLLVRRIQVGP